MTTSQITHSNQFSYQRIDIGRLSHSGIDFLYDNDTDHKDYDQKVKFILDIYRVDIERIKKAFTLLE